jgi:DNA-binding CsgD family transcriptional regulator/tetratricopeptide (TPR) repeat protein
VTARAPVATSPRDAELLERSEPLAALAESLEAVTSESSGRLVLVRGEAGVGKTALLRRFCAGQDRSVRVLWGNCDPLFTPQPLGPFFGVPELEDVVAGDVKPHEVVAALAADLRRPRTTVFVLEDLHWADEATLDVLRLLSRRLETFPALVIGTYRDDELDRASLLRIVLGELGTSDRSARLKLQPLSAAAVAQLARPHGLDQDELYRKTGGNPFFVVEAIAAGAEEIPDTVRDAVFARQAQLSPSAQELLAAVAVVPRRAELWLLEELAGDAVGALDECLASGMLRAEAGGVVFRHELARLAVEDSTSPTKRLELHRTALLALAGHYETADDFARLAHHAEEAGDREAVLRLAPAAGARSAALGAYREAAAQYGRALRFGDRLDDARRAELLELRSRACYLTDQYDEGIAALEEAVELRRGLGDTLKQGDDLRRLAEFLWCPGRVAEAENRAREAVELLEPLPPGRELAAAYVKRAFLCNVSSRGLEGREWARRAIEIAEALGDEEVVLTALDQLAATEGLAALEDAQARARQSGLAEQVAGMFIPLSATAAEAHLHAAAARYLDEGIAYCSERGFELFRLYLLTFRALNELNEGRWDEAADTAASVLRVPRSSTTPRIRTLVILALVRARRGDPGQRELLDEAWALAEPTGELLRLWPVAAGRAEEAWLRGDYDEVRSATESTLALAVDRGAAIPIGDLAVWRFRTGLDDGLAAEAARPYATELAGDASRAAEKWAELGSPYEAALSRAQTDDVEALGRAHDSLQALGAKPAAAFVARRLRERGVAVARGARPATRDNPVNLTARELEVLGLVAEGLRNADIAQRLFLSQKTVDHHVSAILRKLEVRTRGEAGAVGARLGLISTPN